MLYVALIGFPRTTHLHIWIITQLKSTDHLGIVHKYVRMVFSSKVNNRWYVKFFNFTVSFTKLNFTQARGKQLHGTSIIMNKLRYNTPYLRSKLISIPNLTKLRLLEMFSAKYLQKLSCILWECQPLLHCTDSNLLGYQDT